MTDSGNVVCVKAIGQVSSSVLYVDLAVLCVKVIRSLGSSNVVCVKPSVIR